MGNMIKVGMADLKVCKCPDALTTLGLGSCVGVALYDPVTKVSGLLHCMLPDSTQIRNNSNVAKFADTGIDELIRQMENLGASKSRLVAKMAGGAQMFAMASQNESLRVGERNAAAARAKLKEYRIRLLAEDCGLNYGRTVEFYSETGDYVIKSVCRPRRAHRLSRQRRELARGTHRSGRRLPDARPCGASHRQPRKAFHPAPQSALASGRARLFRPRRPDRRVRDHDRF